MPKSIWAQIGVVPDADGVIHLGLEDIKKLPSWKELGTWKPPKKRAAKKPSRPQGLSPTQWKEKLHQKLYKNNEKLNAEDEFQTFLFGNSVESKAFKIFTQALYSKEKDQLVCPELDSKNYVAIALFKWFDINDLEKGEWFKKVRRPGKGIKLAKQPSGDDDILMSNNDKNSSQPMQMTAMHLNQEVKVEPSGDHSLPPKNNQPQCQPLQMDVMHLMPEVKVEPSKDQIILCNSDKTSNIPLKGNFLKDFENAVNVEPSVCQQTRMYGKRSRGFRQESVCFESFSKYLRPSSENSSEKPIVCAELRNGFNEKDEKTIPKTPQPCKQFGEVKLEFILSSEEETIRSIEEEINCNIDATIEKIKNAVPM